MGAARIMEGLEVKIDGPGEASAWLVVTVDSSNSQMRASFEGSCGIQRSEKNIDDRVLNSMEGVLVCDSSESERALPLPLTKEAIMSLNNYSVAFEHAPSFFDVDLPTFKEKLLELNILVWNEPNGRRIERDLHLPPGSYELTYEQPQTPIKTLLSRGIYQVTYEQPQTSIYTLLKTDLDWHYAVESSGDLVILNVKSDAKHIVACQAAYDEYSSDSDDEYASDDEHASDDETYDEYAFSYPSNKDASDKDASASSMAAYDEYTSDELTAPVGMRAGSGLCFFLVMPPKHRQPQPLRAHTNVHVDPKKEANELRRQVEILTQRLAQLEPSLKEEDFETLKAMEFIDWLNTVEREFEFKDAPKNRKGKIVPEVYQRALAVEKQQTRSGNRTGGSQNKFVGLNMVLKVKFDVRMSKRPTTEDVEEYTVEPSYDEYVENKEDNFVYGDTCHMLVIRKSLLLPKEEEYGEWLRNNIFHTTCTIRDEVCKLINDSGSCV
ncbi:hypothetical protein Tco_0228664 [Tanacetum coccineum]